MKAILIFEIEHDDFDDIDYRCSSPTIDFYSIKSGKRVEAYSDLELKPLPKKYIKIAQISNGKVINTEDMQFMAGYNKCLDEILGEEECG